MGETLPEFVYIFMRFTEDPEHPGLPAKGVETAVIWHADLKKFTKGLELEEYLLSESDVFIRVHRLPPAAVRFFDLQNLEKAGPSSRYAQWVREQDEDSRNMAMLYFWDGQALGITHEEGIVSATEPAPLSVDQIKEVFTQLRGHANYAAQTVMTFTPLGHMVMLSPTTITVSDMSKPV